MSLGSRFQVLETKKPVPHSKGRAEHGPAVPPLFSPTASAHPGAITPCPANGGCRDGLPGRHGDRSAVQLGRDLPPPRPHPARTSSGLASRRRRRTRLRHRLCAQYTGAMRPGKIGGSPEHEGAATRPRIAAPGCSSTRTHLSSSSATSQRGSGAARTTLRPRRPRTRAAPPRRRPPRTARRSNRRPGRRPPAGSGRATQRRHRRW